MKTITPTPSGAAVALRKFLATKGHEIKLGTAQEALARAHGYADWQALCAHAGARGSWVPTADPSGTAEPAARESALPPRLGADDMYTDLLGLEHSSGLYAALKPRLEKVMSHLGVGYLRQPGRDDAHQDGGNLPHVEVSFDTAWGRGFRNELVFAVCGGRLEVRVRTWSMHGPGDYEIAKVDDFELDDDAPEPDEASLLAWAQAALKVAAGHRAQLQSWVLG